ncbi:MAG TPA: QsdR family transcriptional regulator [Gemmatimonadaceae bacterium]
MSSVATGRPGRPAAATRQDALALARARFLACERVDVQAIARELGLARATMHRWFGTREVLLGEMLAELGEERLRALRAHTPGTGARALLGCFDSFNRELAATKGMGAWISQEQERALRTLTSSGGIVQPRMVSAIGDLIDTEVQSGAFASAIATETLAYAIVRLAESFLYNDAMFGIRGDTDRLREIEAALLGLDGS